MTLSQTVEMFVVTFCAAAGVAIIAYFVWWLEVRGREIERHRERLAERETRDPGCHAWSAYMAYHLTGGAHVFRGRDAA